jgi:putative transposase
MVENALLCQQLGVLQRTVRRPCLKNRDRLLLVVLASRIRHWPAALLIIQPETVLRWHRELFRLVGKRQSKAQPSKPPLSIATSRLIQQTIRENWLWEAERIRGERLKLGIKVSKRTVQRDRRCMRGPRPPSQTWATFLRNHACQIWACDFVQTYDLFFRALFVFVILEHHSRRVMQVGITYSPTDRWVAQQLKEATAFGAGPKYLIGDKDKKNGSHLSLIAASSGIEELKIPFQSPNRKARYERFIGSLRRECLEHILLFNERPLRTTVTESVRYFNEARPHQGLSQGTPPADGLPSGSSAPRAKIIALPVLGGLHHDYRRVA